MNTPATAATHVQPQVSRLGDGLISRRQARIGLAITVLVLVATALLARDDTRLLQAVSDLRFQGVGPRSLLRFGVSLLAPHIGHLLLGALAVASMLEVREGLPRAARAWHRLQGVAIGAGLGTLAAWCMTGIDTEPLGWHAPGIIEALLPTVSVLTGALLGDLLQQPPLRAFTGALLRLALLAMAGAAAALWAFRALLAPIPMLDVPTARVSTLEKRTLVDLARRHNPLHIAPLHGIQLQVSPQQLGSAVAWAVGIFNPAARARVSASGAALRLEVSIPLAGRHLNVDAALAGMLARDATLQVDQCHLRIGSARLGHWQCATIVRGVHSLLAHHRALSSGFDALQMLGIGSAGLAARYDTLVLDARSKGDLRQLLAPSPVVRAGVDAQLEMLRAQAATLPMSIDPLEAVLRASFELARARSKHSNPAAENQAAILALAGVLGHAKVFAVSGLTPPEDLAALEQGYASIRLRGREDWRRHFFVSAALTQVSNTLMSDAAGLLKEELDSGFSFSDLLMDRAGTLFGETAIRDAAHARALQALVIDDYHVDHIAPRADDMPDGLSDATLQRVHGGVGGPGYVMLMNEIERRVRSARAYRGDLVP